MKEELFNELVASVREGGAILRGETAPSRKFVFEAPDVKAARANLNLTQQEFASLLGISVRTLQNWEQNRRTPHGPARVLLHVAIRHPEALLDVVSAQYDQNQIHYQSSQPSHQVLHDSNETTYE
jgi:putative transcriptional regulator